MSSRRRSLGVSLVELVIFIVIVGIGLAGILGVMNLTTRASAEPLIQKQALAIAEAYLEEVLAMPFTYCDPDDPQAGTAASATVGATGCKIRVEGTGPDTAFSDPGPIVYQASTETRAGVSPFDNVNDYHGVSGAPANIDDVAITPLAGYQVAVAVVQQSLTNGSDAVPGAASLRVTVTVTGPANTTVTLDGYRTRYAPNALP